MSTAHIAINPANKGPAHSRASVESATLSAAAAQRTRSGRKVRGEARDQLLTPEQQVQLMAICASPGPQSRVNDFLVKCGLAPLSVSNASSTWHRYNKAAEDMGFDVAKLRLLQEMADEQGVPLAKLLGDHGLVAVQEMMAAARSGTVEDGAKLMLSAVSKFQYDQRTEILRERAANDQDRIQIERSKLALLEKKAAQADEANQVAANDKLTPEQKAERFKKIFGM